MSLALKQSKAASGANFGGAFMPRSAFQGDPGLFGFLGKVAGAALGVATGGISTAAGGLLDRFRRPAIQQIIPQAGGPGGSMFQEQTVEFPPILIAKPGLGGAVERFLPGGRSGFVEVPSVVPSGHHLNKSDYFLKDGTFIRKGTRVVKNRRRNPLNPRAASRAISRIESAKKATRSLDRISVKCRRCGTVKCSCRR